MEELGVAYRLHMLPFPPRALAADYLQANPLGTIPLMVDGDTRMTESVAICEYLCARHAPTALQVTPDERGFGDYLNALHFGEATLTFPQTLILRYSKLEPPERRSAVVADDYTRWFLSRLKALEPRLAQSDWLAADRFTAADISVAYALMLADFLGLAPLFKPGAAAYWQRLQQRPAYQRARQAEAEAAAAQGVSPRPSPLTSAEDIERQLAGG
jgi:glutathione S-transferase